MNEEIIVDFLNTFDETTTVKELLESIKTSKEQELVDLGLPSGNLWMKCNLGATKETEYGNYYQFGSLKGYQGKEAEEHSTWKTCPFSNGKEKFDKKYFEMNKHMWFDKNNVLKPEYDAVTQTYGPDYKIPTVDDLLELLKYTVRKPIIKDDGSKWIGRLYTSKINGKSILIPFAGSVWRNSFNNSLGLWGGLWSANLNQGFVSEDYSDGIYFLYCSYFYDNGNINKNYCRLGEGISIRGIKVKRD